MGQSNSTSTDEIAIPGSIRMARGVYVVGEDSFFRDGVLVSGPGPVRWDEDIPERKIKVMHARKPGDFMSFLAESNNVVQFRDSGMTLAQDRSQYCRGLVIQGAVIAGIIAVLAFLSK